MTIITPIIIEIHMGDNTHNQDHVITLHNFNTINATVNNPTKPIPPLLLELLLFFINESFPATPFILFRRNLTIHIHLLSVQRKLEVYPAAKPLTSYWFVLLEITRIRCQSSFSFYITLPQNYPRLILSGSRLFYYVMTSSVCSFSFE